MILTAELNQKAKAILIRELGRVYYARFIQQYGEGSRNYPVTATHGTVRIALGLCMNKLPTSAPPANYLVRLAQNYWCRKIECLCSISTTDLFD
jgi:hypothetical protein